MRAKTYTSYIFAFSSFMLSLAMYSSYSIILSMVPLGVSSIMRLATGWMNSWSWLLKKTLP